ncbi:MAG TPA: HupE/UreJ family protein, partial [Bacteroidales bacterium]|nr:HupE/UreJ family protein [Bacteroidales bacterium]
MFTLYLKLGFFHIISLDAYDHILFVTLLTGIYHYRQWKNILALVTAFTL